MCIRDRSQAATFDAAAAQQLVKDGRLDKEKATHVVRHARHRAEKATDRATYQAMEGFVHNLNTMHSRAGAQTPFSSINYGTDTLSLIHIYRPCRQHDAAVHQQQGQHLEAGVF